MKFPLLALPLLALGLIAASAQDGADQRVLIRRIGDRSSPAEMAQVTFLGVEVAPVSPALTDQLSLPDHIGLVIEHVAPDSPAHDALKVHDIVTKLDDQWLIDPTQLAVLVRNHHPGDEVVMTYVHAGKAETASIKLGQHLAPKLLAEGDGPFVEPFDRAHANYFFRSLTPRAITAKRVVRDGNGPLVAEGASQVTLMDANGASFKLSTQDGKKTVVATDPDGKTIFSGSVDTPEQRKALPPEVAHQLDQVEHMKNIRFQADDSFAPPAPPPPPPPPQA